MTLRPTCLEQAIRLLRSEAKRGRSLCLDALATSPYVAPQDEARLAKRLHFVLSLIHI